MSGIGGGAGMSGLGGGAGTSGIGGGAGMPGTGGGAGGSAWARLAPNPSAAIPIPATTPHLTICLLNFISTPVRVAGDRGVRAVAEVVLVARKIKASRMLLVDCFAMGDRSQYNRADTA